MGGVRLSLGVCDDRYASIEQQGAGAAAEEEEEERWQRWSSTLLSIVIPAGHCMTRHAATSVRSLPPPPPPSAPFHHLDLALALHFRPVTDTPSQKRRTV
ncbi:hypothetical protein BST61_g6119 [Cercospora zeina]